MRAEVSSHEVLECPTPTTLAPDVEPSTLTSSVPMRMSPAFGFHFSDLSCPRSATEFRVDPMAAWSLLVFTLVPDSRTLPPTHWSTKAVEVLLETNIGRREGGAAGTFLCTSRVSTLRPKLRSSETSLSSEILPCEENVLLRKRTPSPVIPYTARKSVSYRLRIARLPPRPDVEGYILLLVVSVSVLMHETGLARR